ncbi:MAG: dockerin type I domain-containing protein [Eubacterium sp.]
MVGYLNANANCFPRLSPQYYSNYGQRRNATLKINIKVSGWDADKTVKYGKVNGIDPSEATFTDALSYDVNQDGTIDLLDITEAQRYYRADKNSSNWNDASKCDFNDDGRIDIEDYMAIWLNFTK